LLSLVYVRTYLRTDAGQSDPTIAGRRLSILAVALVFVYAAAYTLIAFDLVMSLVPRWFSTLFGWYFILGGLYAGIAALILMALLLRRWLGVEGQLGPRRLQDLGNLLMAAAMAMTYFFFAQALTIWYENLPPETSFAIPRVHHEPWVPLSWAIVGLCYLGPFVLLVVREMKENPRTLSAVAVLVLLAVWLERYLMVVPSLSARAAPAALLVPFVGLGFLGMFVLTVAPFLARYPATSQLDLALTGEPEAWL